MTELERFTYPPPRATLPALPVADILRPHQTLIERILLLLGCSPKLEKELVSPLIYRYAAFVHLLPASQSQHHASPGGLLRHGLEVGYHALMLSEGIIFHRWGTGTPESRRHAEPRWRLATLIAGLCHDMGKPVMDMEVRAPDGREWIPNAYSLMKWLRDEKIDRYTVEWKEGRGQQHVSQGGHAASRHLFTADLEIYLKTEGNVVTTDLQNALKGVGDSTIGQLVMRGYQISVNRDLKRHRLNAPEPAPSRAKQLITAAQHLLREGRWKVNAPGHPCFVATCDGEVSAYLVYPRAMTDLGDVLRGQGGIGIPRDPFPLAEALVERDVAQTYENPPGTKSLTWPMRFPGREAVLHCMRLAPEILFPDESFPSVIDAVIDVEKSIDTEVKKGSFAVRKTDSQLNLFERSEPAHDEEAQSPRQNTDVVSPREGDARRLLKEAGFAGELLGRMFEAVATGQRKWGQDLGGDEKALYIVWPDGARAYGEPKDVLAALWESGWILPNDTTGERWFFRDGQKILQLVEHVSRSAMALKPASIGSPKPARRAK